MKDKNNYPLVSIITATYNSVNVIEDAINSIKRQTYKNIEYIVIDGGSTDGTTDIIKKHESSIAYWKSEEDHGIGDAWNKGLKKANGKLIGILNADDIYHPETIEKIIVESDSNFDKRVFYGTTYFFNEEGLIRKVDRLFNHKLNMGFGFLHTSLFVPKDIYDKVGVFNDKVKIAVDTEFMLRCLENDVRFIKLKHINYMRTGGVSDVNMISAYKEYISILLDYGFIGKAKSTFLKFTFLFKTPLILFRNSKFFNKVLSNFQNSDEKRRWKKYGQELFEIVNKSSLHD